jgi:hypothetical protein
MWNGFCGDLIRRSNKSLFTLFLFFFLAYLVFYGWNYRYFTGFFEGNHSVSSTELIAANSVKDFKDPFVQITGGATTSSRIYEVSTRGEESGSSETDVIIRALRDPNLQDSLDFGNSQTVFVPSGFVTTQIGGHRLLVRERPFGPLTSYVPPDQTPPSLKVYSTAGYLRPLGSHLQAIVDRRTAAGDGPYLPYYLDTVDYRNFGLWSVSITGIGVLGLVWIFWLWLERSANLAKHPFAKQLAKYGDLEVLIPQVDSEMTNQHVTIRKQAVAVHITKNWYIVTNASRSLSAFYNGIGLTTRDNIARIDSLVWVYRALIRQKHYFITVGKSYQIVVFDRFGIKIQAQMDEAGTAEAFRYLRTIGVSAIFGYDKRLLPLWRRADKNDKSGFVASGQQMIGVQALPDTFTQSR